MLRASSRCALPALKSYTPLNHFSEKIARAELPTTYYKHHPYVLSREKLLSSMWREHIAFKYSVYLVFPAVTYAYLNQA